MAVHRLLLVDDEPGLSQVLSRFLTRSGFQMETAASGEEAWRAIAPDPGRFAAFLIDLTLPEMTGADLAERILGVQPAANIVLTSGYPYDLSGLIATGARVRFLQKPFASKRLAEELRDLIGER